MADIEVPQPEKIVTAADNNAKQWHHDWKLYFDRMCEVTGLTLEQAMMWEVVRATNRMAAAQEAESKTQREMWSGGRAKRWARWLDREMEDREDTEGWKSDG